ncbi:MAG: acyltransferase family protein [Acidimicrobiia bacterium]
MVFSQYLRGVDKAVELTPPTRNRAVDAWRAIALIIVVFGHWLAASVWVTGGDVTVMNTLEWIPYSGWATWIVQVMPVFFFVGGYANARALDAKSANRRSWITQRFRRLYAPAVPVIVAWTALALVLRNFIDADLVYAGVLNATLPLWFLAVYLTLVAVAPLTYAWWKRSGMVSIVVLGAAALAVDVAYIRFDVPGIGWINFFFVWATVHQLGYWWSSRDRSGKMIGPGPSIAISFVALAILIAVTWVGWYPVAMITIPGAGPNNVTPPTSAMTLLALVQIGVILATAPWMQRIMQQDRRWKPVVAISGFMMTIYVWHLTALSLVLAVGIFSFAGAAFSFEPGTAAWWLTRPVFYVVLIAATAALVAAFGIFEHDIDKSEDHRPMPVVALGMVATIVALSAVAFVHLVNREADINWWIPVVAVFAAWMMSAYPASWRSRAT